MVKKKKKLWFNPGKYRDFALACGTQDGYQEGHGSRHQDRAGGAGRKSRDFVGKRHGKTMEPPMG